MFFLQMAGFPGSGKSTLAKEIARRTNAVVIDHDIVKTALLNAMNADEDPKKMGGVSYDIEWALVDALLGQGHNVILDSPCLYEVVRKGSQNSPSPERRPLGKVVLTYINSTLRAPFPSGRCSNSNLTYDPFRTRNLWRDDRKGLNAHAQASSPVQARGMPPG